MQYQPSTQQRPPEGFSFFSPEQRNEMKFLIQEEAQNIVRQSLPMIFSNIQKLSIVKAARIFYYPNFTAERVTAMGEIDQNFDLTDSQRLVEKQKYDQGWEAKFVQFFSEKKVSLPSGYRSWVECMLSINTDMERWNAEITKKQLLEDQLFNKFLQDTVHGVVSGGVPPNPANVAIVHDAGSRRNRDENINQNQQSRDIQNNNNNNNNNDYLDEDSQDENSGNDDHAAPGLQLTHQQIRHRNATMEKRLAQKKNDKGINNNQQQQQQAPVNPANTAARPQFAFVDRHKSPYWPFLGKSHWLSIDSQGRLCWGDKKSPDSPRVPLPAVNLVGDPHWYEHRGCIKCLYHGVNREHALSHGEFQCEHYQPWSVAMHTFPPIRINQKF